MWTFIKYECRYWLASPMLWIFFGINTLLVMGAVSSDEINIGGAVGSVHKNAPYIIQNYYGVMSLICLLMTTAFMNATANRDFQYGMYQFVFSSPIKKRDYFFGKFLGAAVASMIPLLGVSLGALIGPLMPWAEPERYGDVIWSGHVQGILTFGIPNTIITGVWLYGLAILFRNSMVSFIGSMLILVLYVVSQGFTRDIEKEWLANILDPFGFRPENIVAKYLTVDEKNAGPVALKGALLTNRLLWMGISLLTLFVIYFCFSFNRRKEKAAKQKPLENEIELQPSLSTSTWQPATAGKFSFSLFFYLLWHETKAVVRNPTFIIIVAIGLINLVASLTSFTSNYGSDQYPVTYDVVDAIRGSFYLFLLAIITFYSGVLVWKERDAKMSEIQDATPVRTGLLFSTKLLAMVVAIALILCTTIFIGIVAQTAFGYTRYQLGVYIKSLLVFDLFSFTFLAVIALLFHYLINNRYIAYFAFITFVILNSFFWRALHIESNMLRFGNAPDVTYSDMNGFGPFLRPAMWFNVYWLLASVIVCYVIFAFYVRGKETRFADRWAAARQALSKNRFTLLAFGLVFLACSGFVYYNTQVLNPYRTANEDEQRQAEYERKYKKYEHMPHPRYYKLDYTIDIDPAARNLSVGVRAWAKNKSGVAIKDLHFTFPPELDSAELQVAGGRLIQRDRNLKYAIYSLDKPLQPNDSTLVVFHGWRLSRGFENNVKFTQLTQNGTFFNSFDILPSLGYNPNFEIVDKNKRTKMKLPKRERMARLNENDLKARANSYISADADWVEVNTTISTAADQIAIAPGSLIKQWEANGRNYFNYKLDQRSLNFYSFLSARYSVARKRWKDIDLEVYYVPQHSYNVPNMMKSLERSLDYYTKNFGPYYHKQARIIEFPRYAGFAQAFPGTMPYSESIGFIIDLRNVTKDDIDEVYYVVAHEMGHQYWAHQLCGAAMQGSEMMSEGFAQYSALMVMEKEYGKDKMNKFLKYEMDGYLSGRGRELEAERPLMRTENQPYIHYNKASVIMYYLKEMIGEDKVNGALRSLIDTFAYREPPYPTSLSAVRAFEAATPDSLKYLIADLFENITLFSNRAVEATYHKAGNEYEVTLKTTSIKLRADSLGKETEVPVADYIDIGIFARSENGKGLGKPLLMKRLRVTQKENTYVFKTKEKPYQAGIDPYHYLVDRVPGDNLKVLSEEAQ